MTLDTDAHSLAGPYALDALPEPERARFEQHLEECPACRHEAVELSATATHLAVLSGEAPPAHLREQVRARISQVRQLPPRPLLERPVARRRRFDRRKLLLAAAAAVTLVGGVGVTIAQLSDSMRAAGRQDQITAVVAAPDAETQHSDVAGGGRFTAVVSRQSEAVVVIVDRMPRPPRGKTYQLWLEHDRRVRSAGLLDLDDDQPTTRILRNVGPADALNLTIEPRGGSTRPSLPVIARLPFG
ncbi:anti-sigma factor [Flindersiella endophytica]